MKKEKIIGIISGVGPFAGIDLQRKIAEQTMANKDQEHLTVLSISQPSQILDRTEYLLGQVSNNPAGSIASQLILLHEMGAQVAGIPCNTAHAPPIFEEIRSILDDAKCDIRLIHMIEETAVFIQTHHPYIKTIGILSTTGTYQTGIYTQILEPLGFTAVMPDPLMQETVIHPAIYDLEYGIKSGNIAVARENLLQGVYALQAQGAELIILGCTEIPLAFPETKIGSIQLVDPTKILARALIREANPHKLRME